MITYHKHRIMFSDSKADLIDSHRSPKTHQETEISQIAINSSKYQQKIQQFDRYQTDFYLNFIIENEPAGVFLLPNRKLILTDRSAIEFFFFSISNILDLLNEKKRGKCGVFGLKKSLCSTRQQWLANPFYNTAKLVHESQEEVSVRRWALDMWAVIIGLPSLLRTSSAHYEVDKYSILGSSFKYIICCMRKNLMINEFKLLTLK